MSINIVGISAYFHDSACCVLRDGVLVAAAEEERFSRRKHDQSLPRLAFRYCLREAGLTISDIDAIAYYEDPVKKLGRQIWMGLPGLPVDPEILFRFDAQRPEGKIRSLLGYRRKIVVVEHHQAHAASSYYFSGFPDAAILTVDGVGEWNTTTYGWGAGEQMSLFEHVDYPDSLGLLYSTITGYLGFSVNDGEYKVMGLAPYGRPIYKDRMLRLLETTEGGQFRLNLKYFDFLRQDRMHSDELETLFGRLARDPESEIEQFHQDVASSLQAVLEELLLEKVTYLHSRVPSQNLCMAGGVALNCVANGKVLERGPFDRLFVQPAANDAGCALGAAMLAHLQHGGAPHREALRRADLGPAYSNSDVRWLLEATGTKAQDYSGREDALMKAVAQRLANGAVIGWFQGRMEFGPRALGSRSILADPRNPGMRDQINALVKKREAFRPFAPAVLEDRMREHFDIDHASPFMLETCQVTSALSLPAITHVDGSARVQTVSSEYNPRFAHLLAAFEQLTGCPILLNTSFNMRDEPIVCKPLDALLCFVRAGIDTLVMEDFVIDKEAIKPSWKAFLPRWVETPKSTLNHHVYTML